MSDNVTWFGDVSDQHDAMVHESERILDRWVEGGGYSVPRMAAASTVIAFMQFGRSFTDLMRLGNGVAQGTAAGIASDGLRLLSLGGFGGATISRVNRVLVVRQAAGTMTCSWITAANALRRTGQRFYTSLDDLAKTAGVNLSTINSVGSTGQDLKALVQALKKMSVPVQEVTPLSTHLDEVARLAQANRGGVLAFAVNYVQSGRQYGHQLYATFSRLGGLTIVDTTGKVYRSLAALSGAYPGATLHVPKEAFFVIKNAAIVTGAEGAVTVGGLASIVLELVGVSAPATTRGSRGASGAW